MSVMLNPTLSSFRDGAKRRARNPEAVAMRASGFRVRAHSASQTRVNALSGAPRNDDGRVFRVLYFK